MAEKAEETKLMKIYVDYSKETLRVTVLIETTYILKSYSAS
jgi:hypothetical protein